MMKPAWPEQIIRSHKRVIEIYAGYQGFAILQTCEILLEK